MAFELPPFQSTLSPQTPPAAPNFNFNPGPAISTGPAEVALQRQQLQLQQNQQNSDNILRTVKMASDLAQSFVEASKMRQQKDAIAAYAAMQPNQALGNVMKANAPYTAERLIAQATPPAPTTMEQILARQYMTGQPTGNAIQTIQATKTPPKTQQKQVLVDGQPATVNYIPGMGQTPASYTDTAGHPIDGSRIKPILNTGQQGKFVEQQFPDGTIHNIQIMPNGAQIDQGVKKLAPGAVPTTQDVNTAHFAQTVLPHISDLRNLIDQADQKGYIGPSAGRLYQKFLVGQVGSTGNPDADQLLGDLRSTASLVASGALRTHFGARGGQQMYDHFTKNLDTTTQSKALLTGELNGLESFMQGYAALGTHGMGIPTNPQSDQTQAILDALRASLPKKGS